MSVSGLGRAVGAIGDIFNQSRGCHQGAILAPGVAWLCMPGQRPCSPAAVAHAHWTFWIGQRPEARIAAFAASRPGVHTSVG